MARLPVPGSDDGSWGDVLNEFLEVAHDADGMPKDIGVIADKYVKPDAGIPEADLTSGVQSKLNGGLDNDDVLALTDPRFIYHQDPSITYDLVYEFADVAEIDDTIDVEVSGSVSKAVAAHGLSISGQGLGSHLNAVMWPYALGIGQCAETAISVTCRAMNYSLTGILMSDGVTASSNIAGIGLTGQNSGVRAFEPYGGTFNAPDASPPGSDPGAFFMSFQDQARMRITRVSSTLFRAEVGDGVTWSQHGLDWEWNPGFTPTHLGFYVSDFNGNFPVFMRAEYLRTYTP